MPHTHDLVVVGAGPAGLATALGAARVGMDVVLVEQREGPIDKACGEGLMPGAVRALQRLGVDPAGHRLGGIAYRQGHWHADAPFRRGPGRGVRRTVLHDALTAAAHAAGVGFVNAGVDELDPHDDHVRVAGLRARYVAAADGLHSPIRARLGLAQPARQRRRWGLRQHFALAPWSDRVEVTWGDGRAADQEIYVTPVAPDTVGVAVLVGRRQSFADALRAFPAVAERLAGAEPVSAVRGAGPLRQRVTRRVAGRVLLVGDAAGYVDALTGEGLALAFATAGELVEAVRRDRPEHYERAWARVSRRSRLLTTGLVEARHRPALAGRVVPLAARAPWLFAAAVDQLAR